MLIRFPMDAIGPDKMAADNAAQDEIAPDPIASAKPLWRVGSWRLLASLSAASCLLLVPAVRILRDSPPLLSAAVGFTLLGSVLAQGCLLAAWLAWGDLAFGRRLFQHWLGAGFLCLFWLAGLLLFAAGEETPQVGFTVAMTVPLVSLATQFPLWTVRQLFGWRLVRVAHGETPPRERPWSTRDLFLATLIASLSLGLARLSPAFLQAPNFWIMWAIGGTVACVVTSLTILPAANWLLRGEAFRRGVLYSWLYAWLVVALEWTVISVVRWYGITDLPPYYAFLGLSLLILSFAGTVILAARVARVLGYRLVTRMRRTDRALSADPSNE